jgi:hypothetical protein
MNLTTETYEDVAEKALDDLREEVGRPKIQHKKMCIYT